ncbi:MAG: tetratricopeptide repeat protein, partial [Planctomycetota bacterium]
LPWNNNVLSDPKTNLIIQDARAHLQLTKEKYDVIISEPSNPWMAGLATLFTREFFSFAEEKLNDDGIFVQFFHSYQMDWAAFSLIGRTFAQVFPNSLLVLTEPSKIGEDYLLVGFKGKDRLILENAERKLSCIQQSKNVTLSDPKLLYRLIVSEDLQRLFGPGPVNTDSRPRLEFAAPKLMYHNDPMIMRNIQSKKWLTPETRNIVQQVTTDVDAQIDFAAYALSIYLPVRDMVDLSKATPLQKERFFKLMETYCADNSVDYSIFKNDELKQRCRSVQIEAIESRIALMPDKAASHFYLASLYSEKGMLDEVVANCSKALRIKPDYAEAHHNLGTAFTQQGRLDEAITHFTEALRIKRDFADAHYNFGVALIRQGKLDEAITHFKEALRIKPDFVDAHNNFGVALVRQGKLNEAITHFKEALRIKPDFVDAHMKLAFVLGRQGRPDEAITHFKEALRIKPDFVDAHMKMGFALAGQGRLDEAITHFKEALRIKPDFVDAHMKLGFALGGQGRPDEAITHFKEALRIKPNFADAHYNLGVALAQQGKLDEAIIHFTEAIRIKPDFIGAQKALERALLLQKNRNRK